MLLIGTGTHSDKIRQLADTAVGHGLTLTCAESTEAGLELLNSRARSGYPPRLVLIGPDAEPAVTTAKSALRLAPGIHIVFTVETDQQALLRRHIGDAPLNAGDWSVVDIDSDEVIPRLEQLLRSPDQHRQWNNTLERFNRQIAQRRSSKPSEYRKLLVSEKYLNTLLAATPNAVLAVTPGGEIVSWNRAASVLFGLSEEQALSEPMFNLADAEWREQTESLLGRCIDSRQRQHNRFQCTVNNAPVYLETWFLPIEHGAEAPELVSVIVHDITEIKHQEQALRRANEELESSNMELQQFAYIASHDLQSPLRSISGFLQLLEAKYGNRLDAEAAEWIDYTVNNVEKLKTLITDLLTYSRVESRARPFTRVDFNQAFDSAVAMLNASIRDAGAAVTRDELPAVSGDSSQLCQLLLNLISNAIKYQGDRPPTVHVSATQADNQWRFSVSDNGPGIDPQHRERIFDIFRRLHTDRTHPGTGIGLAVCRRVILRHGGRIWVESNAAGGSTFYFTLPANHGADHEHSNSSGQPTG